jgi:hypothetical protein
VAGHALPFVSNRALRSAQGHHCGAAQLVHQDWIQRTLGERSLHVGLVRTLHMQHSTVGVIHHCSCLVGVTEFSHHSNLHVLNCCRLVSSSGKVEHI